MGLVVIEKKIKKLKEIHDETCLKLLDEFEKEKSKIMEQFEPEINAPFLRKTKRNRIIAERDRKIKEVFKKVDEYYLLNHRKGYYLYYYNNVIKKNREKKVLNDYLIIRHIYDKYNTNLKECKTVKEKINLRSQITNEIRQKINKRNLRNTKLLTDKILLLNK